MRGAISSPIIALAGQLGAKPGRLVIAPPDLRTADPTVSNDVYAGHFAFNGRVANTEGRSPFEIEPPSRAWAATLYGFGWLRHLRAADTALAHAQGRALVQDFMALKKPPPIAFDSRVLSRRLMSWVSHSPLILTGADLDVYRRFVKSLHKQVIQLRRILASTEPGLARLEGVIALTYAGLALDKTDGLVMRLLGQLEEELDRQILPDGGHISRGPHVLADLLLDLLPLRQSFVARGLEPPPGLLRAIDRMMPMLRFMRHADGNLALFNGASLVPRDWLATLLTYDDTRANTFENAPHSGYQRLRAQDTVVIADTGPPPPFAYSARANAGCLAFELSTAGRRWIVNCGAPRDEGSPAAQAARVTAAHSTAILAERSSCIFAASGLEQRIVSGPKRVEIERGADDKHVAFTASHDGYASRLGLVHRRTLALQTDGALLSGRDEFLGPPAPDRDQVTLRFHLHPAIRGRGTEDGSHALLVAPDGEAWHFEVAGLPVHVEESIFFAAGDGTRRTEQLVVETRASTHPVIEWSLRRVGRIEQKARASSRASEDQTLPL